MIRKKRFEILIVYYPQPSTFQPRPRRKQPTPAHIIWNVVFDDVSEKFVGSVHEASSAHAFLVLVPTAPTPNHTKPRPQRHRTFSHPARYPQEATFSVVNFSLREVRIESGTDK